MTSLLSQLRDYLREENNTPGLLPIDKDLISRTRDRIRKVGNTLTAREVEDPGPLMEEGEALVETLQDIQTCRFNKILNLAQYPGVQVNLNQLLPHEAKLYQDIITAITVYQGACR